MSLDLAALQGKLLGNQRGGYCFEQNTLFQAVLEALGFSVTGLVARVLWIMPPDGSPNPRMHMLLKVEIDGDSYIADVGFGGYLVAAPLLLAADIEQQVPMGLMRLRQADGAFTLQARVAAGWQDAYRFTLEPQFPVDHEVASWFTSTHPTSIFCHNLLAERLTPEVRVSLFNRRLTRRHADGRVEEMTLASPAELGQVLATEFLLEPPADGTCLFERLPAA